MGRRSNIILTDSDYKIIECVKRVDSLKSSVRELLPGLTYTLPPQQDKMNIMTDLSPEHPEHIAGDRFTRIVGDFEGNKVSGFGYLSVTNI